MNINCDYFTPKEIGGDGYLTTQFASSSCTVINNNIASTTNGFTNGEIMNSLFLTMILLVSIVILFLKIVKKNEF